MSADHLNLSQNTNNILTIMIRFGVILVILAISLATNASFLDENCEVLKVSDGSIHKEFIHLESLKNESDYGEVFRHRFYYNTTSKDYLLKMYFTKAPNPKYLNKESSYWILGEYKIFFTK